MYRICFLLLRVFEQLALALKNRGGSEFTVLNIYFLLFSIFEQLALALIVDLPFRITTCRFLLAIVFHTWGLVCVNLSFASREFVCARSTAFAHHLDSHCAFRFCPSAWTPRFERVELCIANARTTLAVSAVAPSECFSAAANQKPFVNKDLCTRKSVKRTIKWWEPNALLRLGNLKCQAVLVGS